MVERQPHPKVPVYVVQPRDQEGCSQALHNNYLLPISPNLEQVGDDTPVAVVEHTSTSAPMPPVDREPTDSEQSRMATSHAMDNTCQGSLDQPAPLRHSTHATWYQLPWRYQNFTLLADTSPPGILEIWVGLCICLHLISFLYTIFMGSSVNKLYLYHHISARHHSFSIEGNSVNAVSSIFLDGEVDQRLFGLSAAAPPEKKQDSNSHRHSWNVWQSHPKNKVTDRAKQ